MQFVNLTPHTLNIHDVENNVFIVPASGEVARVSSTTSIVDVIDGIEISEVTFGEVVGLPETRKDVRFIVSGLVLSALKGTRADVLAPGELVRDADGRPIGCMGLRR